MPAKLSFHYPQTGTLRVKLSGDWQIYASIPSENEVVAELASHPDTAQIIFDTLEVGSWDSGLVSFLFQLIQDCEGKNIQVVHQGLPPGVEKLLTLALKVHTRVLPQKSARRPFLEKVADKALELYASILSVLNFLGEITVAFGRFISGKAYFRRDDFIAIVQKCGANALWLVSLISVLVGIILAFIGAIQLQLFGAQIFIADIVGIAMVRVMGAVMAAIIMAGRTGASFAAELGLMQVNEEIDAFKTLGISPVEFLVMPRVLALVVMMPLLTLYADFMGIAGGFLISTSVLGLNPVEYWHHTQSAVRLSNLWIGLIHGFVFGIIIAVCGCLRGLRCARSAEGIGVATTSAVVSAITSIVVATAILTFICQVLGV
ncbi:MAG: ABC transporter permease [Candidatus Omnitrophota bacterium]|jgi:phospholipid/cholesterol/gamma-HCH transport system permease protein